MRNLILLFSLLMLNNQLLSYESSRGPSELIYWDPIKASPGYTFIKPLAVGGVFLIDMSGQVINFWKDFTDVYLLEDGTIIGAIGSDTFAQADWDGNILWKYDENRPGYDPHHDFLMIFNEVLGENTLLFVANAPLTHDEVIQMGGDPSLVDNYDGTSIDTITEIRSNGEIIWEWRFIDHLIQDIDPTKDNYVESKKVIADYPEKLDINFGRVSRDYVHVNAIDYNPKLGHIAISSNRTNEVYIIDHDNTFVPNSLEESLELAASEKGDFLYRWGNPAIYGQGSYPYYAKNDWSILEYSGNVQIGGNHDIHWIKDGLPGAGNLLLLNNGLRVPRARGDSTPQSEFIELNPYIGENYEIHDNYVNPPIAGYRTSQLPENNGAYIGGGGNQTDANGGPTRLYSNQIVNGYQTTDGFISHHGSAVQRLPNGNTIVQLARPGRTIEITPNNEVVWEYINPIDRYTKKSYKTLITPVHFNSLGGWSPMRYPLDFPGIQDKDLTPKGNITDIVIDGNTAECDFYC